MGRTASRMEEYRNVYRVSVGRPEGENTSREANINMYFKEVGYVARDRLDFAQDREQWHSYVMVTVLSTPETE